MNIHKNARLTLLGRAELARQIVEDGVPAGEVARAFNVCGKTARKRAERFRRSGEADLSDHSSRPRRLRASTQQAVVDQIITLRRQSFTGKHIARFAGVSSAAVSRILRRAGLNRLRDLDPAEPVKRYERQNPGELIQLDINKPGCSERVGHHITGDRRRQSNSRGVVWEFVHVSIDDASRIAFTQINPGEKAVCAIGFLKAAVAFYKGLCVRIDRIMTDNGSCLRSHIFARAIKWLRLKHIHTKPYTPKTNGKAERFIQTAMREWAYAVAYPSSDQRAAELPLWMHRYNWHRPHGGIKYQTPISCLGLTEDNLLRLHI